MPARRSSNHWHLSMLMAELASVNMVPDPMITGLAADSRDVQPGDLFFARCGQRLDGNAFIPGAIAAGAAAIVTDRPDASGAGGQPVPVVLVPSVPAVMGPVADRFFGQPSGALRVVGVTGTNGKTSVSHYIAHGFTQWSRQTAAAAAASGLIGTLGYGLYGDVRLGSHTTPDALSTHRHLADLKARGAREVVMEVSSHGLDQGRVAGVRFHTAVFTNLSRDHLDYHGDMTAYAATKRRLFEGPDLQHAVINADDAYGRELLRAVPAAVEAIAFGLDAEAGDAAVRGRIISAERSGMSLEVDTPWGHETLNAPVIGRFSGSNLLAAVAALCVGGLPLESACACLASLSPVPGRMERFGGTDGNPLVVVDYAHSPDALASVLNALRAICEGSLWCVFGCGGERDQGKRPMMGALAARGADVVVLTDDNPRHEDGEAIVAAIAAGMPRGHSFIVERDRAEAVRRAVHQAAPEDIVLVAGKGHESMQDFGEFKRPFSDPAAVRAALEAREP